MIASPYEIPRRIEFTHSWSARVRCRIDLGKGAVVPVYQPFVRSPRRGKQFEFQLAGGDEVIATADGVVSMLIHRNDHLLAKITPITSTSDLKFGHRTYTLQVATVHVGDENLQLVCSVYCGIASNHFRVLDPDGSRRCHWKKLGGWGTGNATLLMSRRVPSSFLPIAISATLISLLDD